MKDFILPDIGEGIVECELLKWLVSEGDTVVEDQPIAEVMTDKATVEIPAMHNGIIHKLYYQQGDIAKVHQPLFCMRGIEDNVNDVPAVLPSAPLLTEPQGLKIEAFILPDIGEGIVECEIMQWHIKEGDIVAEDQVVVEVMTDKAVVEIPAKYNGQIVKLHYQKGDIAKVHTPLFDQAIEAAVTPSSSQSRTTQAVLTDNPHKHDIHSAKTSPAQAASQMLDTEAFAGKQGEKYEALIDVGRAIASPAVRRLAKEHGVQLQNVQASGAKGRVLKEDVLKALLSQQSTNTPSTSVQNQPSMLHTTNHAPSAQIQGQDTVETIKGIRAAMGKQMMASVSTIPHFSVSDELCMDKLISLRNSLKPVFEAQSVKLSFMPFFIKALSLAINDYPILNSRLNHDASELTYLSAHNIGIAVDSKIGLLVPNIKNVQTLSLFEIAQQLNGIIERARVGKLTSTELSNGSISISNIGALGGITATPVINKPDVAIVALGKTQTLPRFNKAGEVYASNVMMVNWSGDHRVIDGATMVKFNNLWMDYLCHPEKMLVHLR